MGEMFEWIKQVQPKIQPLMYYAGARLRGLRGWISES